MSLGTYIFVYPVRQNGDVFPEVKPKQTKHINAVVFGLTKTEVNWRKISGPFNKTQTEPARSKCFPCPWNEYVGDVELFPRLKSAYYIHFARVFVQTLCRRNHSKRRKQWIRKNREKESLQSSLSMLALPFSLHVIGHPWESILSLWALYYSVVQTEVNFWTPTLKLWSSNLTHKAMGRFDDQVTHWGTGDWSRSS